METIPHLTLKDFPVICRACFNKEHLKTFNEVDLRDLFKRITDIEIEANDELPNNICHKCILKIEDVSAFITVTRRNDEYLRKVLTEYKMKMHIENSYDSDMPEIEQYFDESGDETNNKVEPFECDTLIKKENPLNYETLNKPNEKIKSVRHSTQAKPSNCEVCSKEFRTKRSLLEHQKQNPSCRIRKFKCENCEKSFFTKFKLDVHMRIHTKESPYECKMCFKKFRHAPNLKRHEDIVHKGLRPFKCETCGKEFATLLRKMEHSRIHSGERPHVCTYCGVGFKKYSTRYDHELRHKIKNGEIPKKDKIPKKYPRKPPKNPSELECKTCNKTFSSKQAVTIHNQIHLGEKSFLCTNCGKGFIRKSHLEVHVRIHTGEKPYKCEECGKHFRQLACYRNHLLIHKGQRSFKCDVCQKTFVQLGHLQSHSKTHTGEKPYKCTFCGKGFAQNGNLKAHTRIHTGERPFRCNVCFVGFYDTTSLKKHKIANGCDEPG